MAVGGRGARLGRGVGGDGGDGTEVTTQQIQIPRGAAELHGICGRISELGGQPPSPIGRQNPTKDSQVPFRGKHEGSVV